VRALSAPARAGVRRQPAAVACGQRWVEHWVRHWVGHCVRPAAGRFR